MKNVSLNFFGEEVSINMPTDLASLRQQISEKFMFSPSDAAEIVVSYVKDLGKVIIQTEQDFVKFVSEKINKIDLDISQDSKLFQKSLNSLQKESEDNKKELEEALKKRDEIKKRKETALKSRKDEMKKLQNKIEEIKKKKRKIQQISNKEEKQFFKQEKDINQKINELQEKLGINKNNNKLKSKSKKPTQIQNMIDECLKSKNEEYKKLDKVPLNIVETINKIVKVVIEHKLKKMHEIENNLKSKKTELKPEEKEFLMNFPRICNDISKRVDSYSNLIKGETKKVIDDIKNVIKNQKQILFPLKKKESKKEEKKGQKNKKDDNKKKEENKIEKEIHMFVRCDGCNMKPIVGKRYKCQVCPNFDFCEKCFEKEKEEHKHDFKTVAQKLFFKKHWEHFKEMKKSEGKAIHYGYICDGCQMEPIIGNRYKCTVCNDFDYCDACEEKYRNEHNHPFLKIYKPTMDPLIFKCNISNP